MLAVNPKIYALIALITTLYPCYAQEANPQGKPQVKVNVLNVCTPSQQEQQEISSALGRIPRHPSFSQDFEVDRGRSVLDQSTNPLASVGMAPATSEGASGHSSAAPASAQFVRIRHDFADNVPLSTVQYSFSRDTEEMVETLVFRVRDPKDLLELSIESRASSVTTPAAMLASATPAGRIKLERFGKSSVVLARCSGANGGPPVDQSAYEPLFSSASSILMDYRGLLQSRKLIPEELARMSGDAVRHKTTGAAHHQ
ncbi:MAG TPA: hypothetical protein VJO35_07530 [Terriglobales bacterium]|nr:hypothetical protein [Terriglobales bacterium]